MEVSPAIARYFEEIDAGLEAAMQLAAAARARGLDPRTEVEIPVASDLADRVEALLGYRGIAARIRELEQEMSREEAALRIGDDFVARKFGETTREDILDHAIRAAMALLTEGVVAAPTEDCKVGLGRNDDGTDYLKIYYAGPIRSAGDSPGTLCACGDYVRRALGIGPSTRPDEVERYIEEIRRYSKHHESPVLPSERAPDDHRELSGLHRWRTDRAAGGERLPEPGTVETNTVRGGMALVVAEGLALKAPKVLKTSGR